MDTYAHVARTGEPQRIENYVQGLDRWLRVYVSRVEDGSSRRCAIVFDDVTDRKRAELALKASEERQAFLLRLSDALRLLAEPAAIKATASRFLGEQLRVNRAFYVEPEDGELQAHRGIGVSLGSSDRSIGRDADTRRLDRTLSQLSGGAR